MGKLTSNLSLYDLLSMLLPGGILIFVASQHCPDLHANINSLATENTIACSTFVFTLAYIAGICNHLSASTLWRFLRNNPQILSISLKKTKSQFIKTPNLNSLIKQENTNDSQALAFTQIPYIIAAGITVAIVVVDITFSISTTTYIFMSILGVCFLLWMSTTSWRNGNAEKNKAITEAYYEAYYFVLQESKNNDISVMESQVAFMQSMFIPMALLITIHWEPNDASISLRLILFLVYVGIFPVVYNRIIKIHSRIWEDYEFLNRTIQKKNF